MDWQGMHLLMFFWCCIDLVPSQNGKLITDLDHFVGLVSVDSDGEADKSEILAQDSRREMKSQLVVYCYNNSMKVILPSGSLSQVKILGFAVIESALESACGYSLTQAHGHNILVVDYTGCHVALKDGHYILRVLYPNEAGKLDVFKLSCDINQRHNASLKLLDVKPDQMLPQPRTKLFPSPFPSTPNLPLVKSKPAGCTISTDQRVLCGGSSIKQEECLNRGCCFDVVSSFCYYPMDECTADKNFVFAVYNNFANVPVNPMSFIVSGKAGCKPVISNNAFAIFKFSVTDCGTRSFVIGKMSIYLAEIETINRVLNLKYGMISRDDPIRLVVECRYQVSGGPVLASAGYMVMSPSLPPYLLSEGLFGVQLLISEDETFTKFYPQFHQPLHVLLGKPVYLELRLRSPKSTATLLVHYCVAYPRSAKSALVLLFEGCPNPLDSSNTSILYAKHLPQNPYQRRFEIKAFQFMDLSTNKYLNEEVYFMCSTEVCMPSGSPCAETCFDGKVCCAKLVYI